MRFLRVIRLDESDAEVFERPATPGEWAVPGSFAFLDVDPNALTGKRLQAFNHGFLGTETFGWSSLVEVAEISELDYKGVIERLAHHFVEHYGAPALAAALPKAREEAQYTASIAEHELHTLLAIERETSGEDLVENLRVVRLSGADHTKLKVFGIEPDDDA
ncbi:MAG: hypothetical protein GWN84_22440 [Gammaproteobacteria bacterium]|nr:hypothetical protein [Gammaproteobacteria bacterium]NIR85394.1 hypothetical protein [Gammaproteobacteria bacterium]NIR88912.1 hypothetical protein [Gammaproteobacteria bacterium]NIU06520.1 hypothetical protein [Gammaproteobacteria bacterium]NIV53413.1 hypothetical protein [Gammaproteobacteria bacterium]